jgi:lauroyl/myristoyl acyltransferase
MTRPVEKWAGVTERFYWFERGLRSGRFRRFRNRVAAFFGPEADDAFASQLWRAHRTSRHRRRLQIVAARLGSGYRPEIQFEGRERLDAALAHGRGVILWLDNFMHHAVIGKRPFADAGYISWQLSSVDHGLSRSRFGHAFLNPIQLSVEESYVAARVEFDGASALAATREVGERLAANGIVRITNNAYLGRRFVNTPFGASAWLSVATTPLNFARKSGAVLLPVAVFENVPFRRYSVTIGEPLPVGSDDRESAFRDTALLYAAYLEPLVRAHPEQWLAWQGPIDQPPSG